MVNMQRHAAPNRGAAWKMVIFLAILVLGIFYVKWDPYSHKAFIAASTHSLGASIVSGTSAAPPAVGWHAAIRYALLYGKEIWEAFLVGLLVGAGVQTLVPRNWLIRVLGRGRYKSTVVAGVASIPAMM